ncbi:MAG: pyrimidine/purine nucleoside phosphorylase [Acidobacteriaceae bacterium]
MSFAKQHPKESTGWLASTRRSATSTELYGLNQSLRFQDGQNYDVSVGVIVPGEYNFSTDSAERVEILFGSLRFKSEAGSWRVVDKGKCYEVSAKSSFSINCTERVAYMCHFLQ